METKPRFLLLDFAERLDTDPPLAFTLAFGEGRGTRYMARINGPMPDAPFVPKDLIGLYRVADHPDIYIGTDPNCFGIQEARLLARRYSGPEDVFTILHVNPNVLDEITFEQAVAHELGADVDTSLKAIEDYNDVPFVVVRETHGYKPWFNVKQQPEKSIYHFMKLNHIGSTFHEIGDGADFYDFCAGATDYFARVIPAGEVHTDLPKKIQMWNLRLHRKFDPDSAP